MSIDSVLERFTRTQRVEFCTLADVYHCLDCDYQLVTIARDDGSILMGNADLLISHVDSHFG